MAKKKTLEAATQDDFGPETLLIFVGHSSDTAAEIDIIKNLQNLLQDELKAFLDAAPNTHSFKVIKVWEWNYDAPRKVGGQAKVISPYLQSANVAVFIFKERVGKVTWDELIECRDRKENPIPIIVLFPTQHPDVTKLSDIDAVKAWADLLNKKEVLTKDWTKTNSRSITPIKSYADDDQLREIVFSEIKRSIPNVLKSTQIHHPFVPLPEKSQKFLGESGEFSFDQRPVVGCTWDELDQTQIKDFLSKKLSIDAASRAGNSSPSILEHLRILGLLQNEHPFLGAFLCFAPQLLNAGKFHSSSLQLVRYDGTNKADSISDSTPITDNLLRLFDEGLTWLRSRSGLKRIGTVGSSRRDDLEIPEIALREALANALVHRNYEGTECRDQPTRIEVFDDRVVITSCGKLPGEISAEELNNDSENVIPFRRNPIIAQIFNNMTHVELNASGVSRMQIAAQKAFLPTPKIYEKKGFVQVVFTRRSIEAIESQIRGSSIQSRPSSKSIISVFISSTARDLSVYRENAVQACLEQGTFPVTMENLPALDSEAISLSLEMVNQADIYIGIFAHYYGYVPRENNPLKISITEMEYNRAVELDLPRLIFLIDEDFPVSPLLVDKGSAATKLHRLKKRLGAERVVKIFTSPENLHTHIVSSLAELAKISEGDGWSKQATAVGMKDFPPPPEKYIAHPYLLLQTRELIGRRGEFNLLNEWVSNVDSDIYRRHIFSFVGIGGLGKSALTWQWFNELTPKKMEGLSGRMWWSFYDRNADFENFVLHALAYASDTSVEDIRQQLSPPERETRLLAALDQKPFLIVLDGFERVLNAYSRGDAAHLEDTEVDVHGNARKTADPRVGQFLKKLAQVKKSRILISTRLQPAELENEVDHPLPGVYKYVLKSLPDTDAIDLWKGLGVEGARNTLLHLFKQFDKHTLLIQVLAGEVRRFRAAPGDLEKWLVANPRFDPAKYSKTKDRTAHVLEFSLSRLGADELEVLNTIVAFRNPPSYATLASILIGQGKPCADKDRLDEILTDLEDRGLIGWNRQQDLYEIHPIVRSVVWSRLSEDAKRDIYIGLYAHFEAMPMVKDWTEIESLKDLTPTIELYNILIGMGRYEDAQIVFRDRLNEAMLFKLSASRQRVEMLEMLFPDGTDNPPLLSNQPDQAYTLSALAQGYQLIGQPGRTIPLVRRANEIYRETDDNRNLGVTLRVLSNALRVTGDLRESEGLLRKALQIAERMKDPIHELAGLQLLGLTLAARNKVGDSEKALRRSLRIRQMKSTRQGEVLVNSYRAQRAIWSGDYKEALRFADLAWELAHVQRSEGDFIRAARVQGEAALWLNDIARADERLHHALTRARAVNLVQEELPALIALAELRRRQGDEKAAREFLDDVWEYAERGPYPLFNADALNVLAQIEIDAGNKEAAVEAATKAYQLAWCDGPPYAYHWGLIKAQKHLEELGAPLPEMPPFDESKFEPMPDVEIDPDDEFHVGESQ